MSSLHKYNVKLIKLVASLLCAMTLTSIRADDFYWVGGCSGDLYAPWYASCSMGSCSGNGTMFINNWGRTICNAQPATPNSTDNVFLSGGSIPWLAGTAAVYQLHIDGSSSLQILSTGTLKLHGPTQLNNGTIQMATTNGFGVAILDCEANTTFTGSGTIDTLPQFPGGVIRSLNGAVLTNASGHTMKGELRLDASMVNQGVINCHRGNMVFQILPKTNQNLIKSEGEGVLIFRNVPVFQTSNGVIHADNRFIYLEGATIEGGTLKATGANGLFVTRNATSTLKNVTLSEGTNVVQHFLQLTGNHFTNQGTVYSNRSTIHIDGTMSLLGTGMIQFTGSNIIPGTGFTVTNFQTIRGAGTLELNGTLINRGTIIAEVDFLTNTIVMNSAGRFNNRGSVIVDSAGLNTNGGNYRQSAGETVVNGSMRINGGYKMDLRGGELKGRGLIYGHVECSQTGVVSPGTSVGDLTMLNSNYTQTAEGTLFVEIAGVNVGQYDRFTVSGNAPNGIANLNGTLRVEFLDGFTPSVGQEFPVLYYRHRNGQFSSVVVENLPFGQSVRLVYQSDRMIVKMITTGDANNDGCVNDVDLLAVLFTLGSTGAGLTGDLDNNGTVDDNDLLIVLFNFGAGC